MPERPVFIAILGVIFAAAAAAIAGAQSGAADFPDHPIRIVVSVPPGGGVDSVTRMVADKMRAALGRSVIVENRTGGAHGA